MRIVGIGGVDDLGGGEEEKGEGKGGRRGGGREGWNGGGDEVGVEGEGGIYIYMNTEVLFYLR